LSAVLVLVVSIPEHDASMFTNIVVVLVFPFMNKCQLQAGPVF